MILHAQSRETLNNIFDVCMEFVEAPNIYTKCVFLYTTHNTLFDKDC